MASRICAAKGRLIATGTSVVGGVLRLKDADDSNQIDIGAPATLSSNLSFTLPSADGSSGQFLKTMTRVTSRSLLQVVGHQ